MTGSGTHGSRFTGRVVLVTGGGSGIGSAVALGFAREGAAVVVAGRDAEKLADTVDRIRAEGGEVSSTVADVTRAESVARMVDAVVGRHGRLDIAVNNAGILGPPGPLADLGVADWEAVLATNLTGVWLSMKYQIPAMRAQGGGAIVNVASNVGAHLRVPGLGAYAASKAGVSALTRAAAREYIRDGIRINAVSPGPVATAMTLLPGESEAERDARIGAVLPIGRPGRVEEVVAAILWLASPEASFLVGHDLVVDGGATA